LDEDAGAVLDHSAECDHVHRLDLRSPETARCRTESAYPLMLRAIAGAKKKNDRIDASKWCDCLRRDFLPECYLPPVRVHNG